MGCINAYLPIVIIILDQIDTMLYGNYSIKTYTLQKNSSLLSEVSQVDVFNRVLSPSIWTYYLPETNPDPSSIVCDICKAQHFHVIRNYRDKHLCLK